MNRTERLYAIAEALRAAGDDGRTSEWLAARFEVSTRTIKRDVTALQEAGRPIAGSGGRGGGYRIDPAVTLPPIAFTPAEAIAIATLMSVHGRRARTRPRAAGRWPRCSTRWCRAGAPARRRSPGGCGRARGDGVRPVARPSRVVEEAVAPTGRRRHRLRRRRRGTETRRRPVEPLGFANTRGTWYLMAWCRRRRAGRWFRARSHPPGRPHDAAGAAA